MNETRSSVRISISLRNQLKVLAKKLASQERLTQRSNRVTIVGLLEEGIDDLFSVPLVELFTWAKEGRKPGTVGEESISIRIDAERARKISLLAATIQEQIAVPFLIVDLTEEAGRRIISRIEQGESNGLVPIDKKNVSFLQRKKENSDMEETFESTLNTNDKGGVGKTTLSLLIASILAAAGYNVGLVDADKQRNATSLARPRTQFPANLTQVVKGEKTMREAMVQIRKRLWLVPSDFQLKDAIDHITTARDFNIISYRVAELRQELKPTPPRDRFSWWNKPTVNISIFQLENTTDEEFLTPPDFLDFLFFDTPPQENDLTLSILDACDKVYIPVNMDQFSIDGLAQLINRIALRFKDRPRKIKITGVIPNEILHRAGNSLPMTFLENVWKHFPTLARRTIHYDDTIQIAQALGKVALEVNRDSRAVRELCALALEIAGWHGDMAGIPYCEMCDSAVERAQSLTVKEA